MKKSVKYNLLGGAEKSNNSKRDLDITSSGGKEANLGAGQGVGQGEGVNSNPIKTSSAVMARMHKEGKLKNYLNDVMSAVGMYFGIFFLLITMPAMPVIIYLSVLYNVILLTWERFKSLDHYKQ